MKRSLSKAIKSFFQRKSRKKTNVLPVLNVDDAAKWIHKLTNIDTDTIIEVLDAETRYMIRLGIAKAK